MQVKKIFVVTHSLYENVYIYSESALFFLSIPILILNDYIFKSYYFSLELQEKNIFIEGKKCPSLSMCASLNLFIIISSLTNYLILSMLLFECQIYIYIQYITYTLKNIVSCILRVLILHLSLLTMTNEYEYIAYSFSNLFSYIMMLVAVMVSFFNIKFCYKVFIEILTVCHLFNKAGISIGLLIIFYFIL